MAASKDRIVSKGRSSRGRVGLDRSGSASNCQLLSLVDKVERTDNVPMNVSMLDGPNRLDSRFFMSHSCYAQGYYT